MGHNLRRNFPFSAPSSELTRTNSDSSGSGVIIDSFRNPTATARPGQNMVWTNEKHNSYLEFLEASFVKQLHCSMNLCGCHPRKEMWDPCTSLQLPAKGHNSSHQFSILEDDCYQKSNEPLLDSTADSSDILGSPWLHHFTSAGKSSSATFPVQRETVVPGDRIYLRSNSNSGGCTTEVSDQNFSDEEQTEKTSCVSGASNGKVSPLGKLNSVYDLIIDNTSAERGKRRNCCQNAL